MAYQMAATAVTLNDLEGHSLTGFRPFRMQSVEHLGPMQHLFISTDNVLAVPLR